MASGPILYISYDGALQPLGYSQIVRPLLGLSQLGFRYVLLSFERVQDLQNLEHKAQVAKALSDAGIDWHPQPYLTPGPKAATKNAANGARRTLSLCRRYGVRLVHARGYQPAAFGWLAKKALSTPYLFDFRGYWIDERAESGRWFKRPRIYAGAKFAERALYQEAAGAVSLTQLGIDDLRSAQLGAWPQSRPAVVITTCVDFERFGLRAPRPESLAPLSDKLVLGFVGSVNPSYQVDESLALFAAVARRREDAHLLCLTGQPQVLTERLRAAKIPAAQSTVRSVPHTQIADWLPHIDWGLLLLNSSFAKRASMPTKLGEFLASGVRPIHHGCNEEVGDWVRKAGSGLSLERTDPASIEAAADRVADSDGQWGSQAKAREVAETHFSLARGIEAYAALLRQLL